MIGFEGNTYDYQAERELQAQEQENERIEADAGSLLDNAKYVRNTVLENYWSYESGTLMNHIISEIVSGDLKCSIDELRDILREELFATAKKLAKEMRDE